MPITITVERTRFSSGTVEATITLSNISDSNMYVVGHESPIISYIEDKCTLLFTSSNVLLRTLFYDSVWPFPFNHHFECIEPNSSITFNCSHTFDKPIPCSALSTSFEFVCLSQSTYEGAAEFVGESLFTYLCDNERLVSKYNIEITP